jgi:hypothetical protein
VTSEIAKLGWTLLALGLAQGPTEGFENMEIKRGVANCAGKISVATVEEYQLISEVVTLPSGLIAFRNWRSRL